MRVNMLSRGDSTRQGGSKMTIFEEKIMELQHYRIYRLRCRRCGSIIEWENRSKDDRGPGRVLYCQCGKVGMDPAAWLPRIIVSSPATFDDVEQFFEPWED